MKYKKHLIIFMFIVIVIVCYFSYINKNYTSYDVTIQGMIISNNGKQLVFEGFPQNPKGKRGTYIVKIVINWIYIMISPIVRFPLNLWKKAIISLFIIKTEFKHLRYVQGIWMNFFH